MLTVCNPNENKVEQKDPQRDKAKLGSETTDIAQKTPQKSVPGEFNDGIIKFLCLIYGNS